MAILTSFSMTGLLLSALALLQLGYLARADNPIIQDIYTADPAPVLHDGRVYLFTGHDEDASTWFDMRDWRLFSTDDMANWKHHPSPMSVNTFSWASDSAWAGQVVARNGKFYFYVPIRRSGGNMAIGVGVSDTITGPYVDAIGAPLVENGQIDPTIFIDDDGQAYLYWGNPDLWYVKLNNDMISYSGGVVKTELTTAGFGTRPNNPDRATMFEEGPWLYKRNGLYYMLFAANCCSEDIRYATGPTATGPWTYRGLIMSTQGSSFTNHVGVVDYLDKSYFFYHNGALSGGGGFTRSVAVESFQYNSDGSIPELWMTSQGPEQIKTLDPFTPQEAETMAWSQGIETEACSEGGLSVAYINNGDYVKVKGVGFGDGASSFTARVSSGGPGGTIELRLDAFNGELAGSCTVQNTGGWQDWRTITCPISRVTGTHDLFLSFKGGNDYLFNINWWQFGK